ncbi:hypothetical protein BCR34DRAFT_316920 [Clohesyomyces aquaticus]|uniref:Transcription factor domain-containing protein n=1 Tax=Clohesyomyces aquaticus TaxID=1231657 RepID=A0A1Y1ZNA2_9PLEO|nr:hypothetical protein BCR34DRAFT_316920 [Clohesyomyces aquaticus]
MQIRRYAHAWRKPSTMAYTKFMGLCCQSLTEHCEAPTDTLIPPLVQGSDLMYRVSEYYSYDDIDSADVRGEMFLEMSTQSFRRELEVIREAVPSSAKENILLRLQFHLLDLWIHECAIHSSLWGPPDPTHTSQLSQSRLKMLNRCIRTVKTYLKALIDCPESGLYPLSFPAWSGWFYAIIITCKLVFLQENDRHGQPGPLGVPQELVSLLPGHFGPGAPHGFAALPQGDRSRDLWDPVSVAKEIQIPELFERFIEKMKFTFPYPGFEFPSPDDLAAEGQNRDRNALFSIAWLQRSLLHGFNKRMLDHIPKISTASASSYREKSPSAARQNTTPSSTMGPAQDTQMTPGDFYLQQVRNHPIPFLDSLHFDTTNYGTVDAAPAPVQQDMFEDWVWDSVMEDFSFPAM